MQLKEKKKKRKFGKGVTTKLQIAWDKMTWSEKD